MKKIIFGLVGFVIAVNVQAQAESKKLEIKSASWQFGLYTGESGVSSFSDFQKLAPEMKLTEADLSGFSRNAGFLENSGPAFSANLILAKPSEDALRFNPEFRFGVSYQEAGLLNLRYNKRDEFRIDTLRSSQTGEEYYVDSVRNQNYYLTYNQRQIMVDGDVIISTNPEKRWKFYVGIGVSLGMSISPSTQVAYDATSIIENRNVDRDDFEFDFEGSTEQFANKSGVFGRVYLPLGVDFKIGKRKESLKKYHIFLESRQSLNFQTISELSPILTTSSVGGFGLRYDF